MQASIEEGHPFLALDRSARRRACGPRRAIYMQTQVEAGHGCPITMTFAVRPCLRLEPELAARWLPKIEARRL